MAFPTGHTAPSGFSAGQLRDGSEFGTFTIPWPYIGATGAKLKVRFRYYKNTLIGLARTEQSDGTVIEDWWVKSREYFKNFESGMPQTFKDMLALIASQAQLSAIGVVESGQVPVNSTNGLIPFEMTADGVVKPFNDPTAQAQQQQDLLKAQTNFLQQIASGGTTSGTTSGGTTSSSSNLLLYGGIIAAAVVVVVLVVRSMRKKKKK